MTEGDARSTSTPRFLLFYFSPEGRISRLRYWIGYVLPVVMITSTLLIAGGVAQAKENYSLVGLFEVLSRLFLFVMSWPFFAVLIRRIHDRGKPGWTVLLPVVAGALAVAAVRAGGKMASPGAVGIAIGIAGVVFLAVLIWFLIEFGLMRGTVGPNRYGPDPAARRRVDDRDEPRCRAELSPAPIVAADQRSSPPPKSPPPKSLPPRSPSSPPP